jgi:hypothetical protein
MMIGFWGWKCQSYFYYLFGMCAPTSDMQALAGEDCRKTTQGMYFINTNALSPFALGRIMESSTKSQQQQPSLPQISINAIPHTDPFQRSVDALGKLEGNFNNLQHPTSEHDISEYFINRGSNRVTHSFVSRLRHQNEESESMARTRQVKMPSSLSSSSSADSRQSRDDNHIRSNEIVNERQ